ncbi:[FeFe] hydrogenase H-cluster radical SAM maturase HydG [Salinispira pacifica]|uniref:[FeFe]-hydrogenase maturation protein HydG n=1 Tax=Salinispira pacifica TaxID=1307761 RepID=V5WI78_9SPIO|nr:[FeFe] hydrogenase H-cluster radical SAM maturase HydG [Salinispira pacifica]AHC15335.1 [FeFe]-hydrogenase maturation protein HydG [Salinispira pacifica]
MADQNRSESGGGRIRTWIDQVVRQDEIDPYLEQGKPFINEERIWREIASGSNPTPERVRDILKKSLEIQSLSPEETAVLLNVKDRQLLREMADTAARVKQKVYDSRIVTFAPLYLSNHCVNSCLYCGFRQDNGGMKRSRLSMEEIRRETEALAGKFGHKRLIVVYGEHPDSDIDFMEKSINQIYQVRAKTRKGHGSIRRVNVNAAPMSVEKLRRLKNVGVGTYQVFQESYHPGTYSQAHPPGTLKGNYLWRLFSMHRAMDAGIDDVGIGALFGLYDWRFEVMGLVHHARDLERRYNGIGPHTISFPRLEQADNAPFLNDMKYRVSDEDFLKIITILRLAVPYTGLIITAREPAHIRDKAVKLGVTQMDASTRIGLGAYSRETDGQEISSQQFMLGDTRSLEELIGDLADMGCITSFCTAGYRIGRTGERIMKLLRECHEGDFCRMNAVITFREWLDDFASPEIKVRGEALIARELAGINRDLPKYQGKFRPMYDSTCRGKRDLYL